MTDYHTVIAQAVESLDQNTSRTRQVLYKRARAAQVTHLRAIHPPLPELAIAKERLSLESAIRKVEADTSQRSSRVQASTASRLMKLSMSVLNSANLMRSCATCGVRKT